MFKYYKSYLIHAVVKFEKALQWSSLCRWSYILTEYAILLEILNDVDLSIGIIYFIDPL